MGLWFHYSYTNYWSQQAQCLPTFSPTPAFLYTLGTEKVVALVFSVPFFTCLRSSQNPFLLTGSPVCSWPYFDISFPCVLALQVEQSGKRTELCVPDALCSLPPGFPVVFLLSLCHLETLGLLLHMWLSHVRVCKYLNLTCSGQAIFLLSLAQLSKHGFIIYVSLTKSKLGLWGSEKDTVRFQLNVMWKPAGRISGWSWVCAP